jgi:hypothetical protein
MTESRTHRTKAISLECGMVAPRFERDPEDRFIDPSDGEAKQEKMFDKTIADSFPASDPPSTVPDPHEDSF